MLLLDEPFGALDAKVRQELRQWLRRLHDEIHVTSVFVTHDQEEAFEVADRVVVMNQGRIEQVGTPAEVFEHPANPFVMDFLGNVNVFHGRVQGGRATLGGLEVAYPEYPHDESRAATAFVRSHELEILRAEERPAEPGGEGRARQPGAPRREGARCYAEAFGVVLNVDVQLGSLRRAAAAASATRSTWRRGRCASSSRTTRSEADGMEERHGKRDCTATTTDARSGPRRARAHHRRRCAGCATAP